MTTMTGSATRTIPARPDAVFAAITDIDGLPAWNARMTQVVEAPLALVPGAEWVVGFRVLGRRWNSRSIVEAIDVQARRLIHVTGTDDGNPSRSTWTWEVADDPEGSRVTVSWELHPVTLWRRVLFGKVRARQLERDEVPASLAALAARCRSSV